MDILEGYIYFEKKYFSKKNYRGNYTEGYKGI